MIFSLSVCYMMPVTDWQTEKGLNISQWKMTKSNRQREIGLTSHIAEKQYFWSKLNHNSTILKYHICSSLLSCPIFYYPYKIKVEISILLSDWSTALSVLMIANERKDDSLEQLMFILLTIIRWNVCLVTVMWTFKSNRKEAVNLFNNILFYR